MTFRWPIPGWVIGQPERPEVWLASRVLPMGWVSSVSLFQHLHRRIGLEQPPVGAGLRSDDEMRRDRPTPRSATRSEGGWISYYLDDFDCPEIMPRSMWENLKGTMSPIHARQRKAYETAGVKISPDKSHVREVKVERMGGEIDGDLGYLGVSVEKKLEVGYMFLWSLGKVAVPQKVVLMILGRLVRCYEFRRPLMSLLNRAWPKKRQFIARPYTLDCFREMVYSICVLPLAISDLRTPVSGLVTCSDASEHGGGLCASAGLTAEGRKMLEDAENPMNTREAVSFRPAGSVSMGNWNKGPRVLVVSLFDGIAAMMVALARLECQIVGFAASEIDKPCKRLVRTRWPGLIELGDIVKIDDKVVEHLAAAVGYKVDLILCGAGSPCQDLSSLRAGGQGLLGEKSKLFFEVPRVIQLLKDHFNVPVESFVENVASMTPENMMMFSDVLKCEPVLVDAKYFTHCRRPRLFWTSWGITPQVGEKLIAKPGHCEWQFPICRKPASDWLEDGCTWESETQTLIPTFTRPQRREKPPYKPAGLETASEAAIVRWKEDKYYVQVYNYEKEHMITTPAGHLRLPTLEEKELMMGFDRGYVSRSFGPKTKNADKELIGGQMIGNSYCVYPVMMLLHECLRRHGNREPRDHQQLVRIGGISPDAWSKYPKFVSGSKETKEVRRLVSHIIRHGERGGTDVKLCVNMPFRLRAWPRAGLPASLFQWSIIHGYKWRGDAHINCLELQAVINGLKWRLRRASNMGHRVLHLIDSQVVASILTKGRTSSFRLQLAVNKYSALVVASGTIVCLGYVDTRDNPSDIPSRWADP